MNIESIDLNLLVAFDAMMQERNVTRAGQRVGLSQPSMSHALTRLRQLCGDPLFVRVKSGMEPTPFALRIGPSVRAGLAVLQAGLEEAVAFDPARSERTFQILLSDLGEVVYLPRLMRHLKQVAPGIGLRILQLPRERYREALESGDADLAVGFLPGLAAGFYQQRLFSDYHVCLVRADHPRIGATLNLQQFTEESHIMIEPAGSRYSRAALHCSTTTLIEQYLEKLGLRRHIALRVPHFTIVPDILAATELLVVIPSTVARLMMPLRHVKTLPLPFEAPEFEVKQFWHERSHQDDGTRWLRGVFADLFMERRMPVPAPQSLQGQVSVVAVS
ncbi:MAG: LysR family transcriptional regulator [Pigmentiphaga sp.]|uniref:LysR family transcriptional regulator n=1 Tax=Pigmentiphaga sp. TaxID=1977564 RepID=UPI0029BF7D8D|nr:LysR family transcriptional regulator [Pigmentiphaga sp.]MDX3904588.1 LysR family transcriptional regulator [Pigmentiphaga sp.]